MDISREFALLLHEITAWNVTGSVRKMRSTTSDTFSDLAINKWLFPTNIIHHFFVFSKWKPIRKRFYREVLEMTKNREILHRNCSTLCVTSQILLRTHFLIVFHLEKKNTFGRISLFNIYFGLWNTRMADTSSENASLVFFEIFGPFQSYLSDRVWR